MPIGERTLTSVRVSLVCPNCSRKLRKRVQYQDGGRALSDTFCPECKYLMDFSGANKEEKEALKNG